MSEETNLAGGWEQGEKRDWSSTLLLMSIPPIIKSLNSHH